MVSACDGGSSSAVPDATSSTPDAFVCPPTPDEPSSSTQEAVDTGVASTQSSAALTGLMICPAGDKDYFKVVITNTGLSLEAVIEHAAAEPTVQVALLNDAGTPISNGAPVAGMPAQRVAVPNLAAGVYFVRAVAGPGDISHYKLTLDATEP